MRKRIVWGSALGVAAALGAITAMTALAAVPAQNLNKAIEAQQKLTAAHPEDPAVWNDLGNLLLLAHKPEPAETAYRKAVELDGTKVSTLFNLGLLLQAKGQLKDAQKLFAQVSTLDPKNAWAHYQMGAIYESWKKKEPAIKEYAQAFALDPQLAFPEVNPHIVENRLVTESMLRAYRGDYGGPQVPTVYDDPSRIASILVPPPPKPADANQDAQANANAQQQQPKGPATVLRRGDLNSNSNVGQATPQAGVPGAAPPTRTFGRPTVGGANPSGGVPGMAGRTPTRTFNRPDPSGRTLVPAEGAQPGPVVTPPPTGIYYRPGLPSTGRLELRVVPDSARS